MLLSLSVLTTLILACSDAPAAPAPTPTSTQPESTRAIQVQPTSTPRAVPAPTASPAPPIPGISLSDAQYGDPVPFPDNTMMLIERGCTSCDGPAESLWRVYRNEGEIHYEQIFEATPVPGEDTYITSLAIGQGASEIVIVVCTKEYCGGLGFPRAGAEATFYRSSDAGATWTPLEVSQKYFHVLGSTRQGFIKGHFGHEPEYALGKRELRPPAETAHPISTGDGRFYWRNRTQVLYEGGQIRIDASFADYLIDVVERDPGNAPILSWGTERVGPVPGAVYMTTIGADGTHYGLRLATSLQMAEWLDHRTMVATMDDLTRTIGRIPGLLNWETGVLSAIGDYPEALHGGRNTVHAVVRGPFLRVVIEDGCVYFRNAPSIGSSIIGCIAVGALVKDIDGAGGGPGRWVRVQLFDGRIGFIAGEYLIE